MKNKKLAISIGFVALLVLISMACNSANIPFLATPTPTSTLTPTPTPTPTITPSPTPIPKPKIEEAILILSDFPSGYTIIPNTQSEPEGQISYGFINAASFHILSGVVMDISADSDSIGFDLMVNNPDFVIEVIATGLGDSEFKNMKQLEGLDKYSDISNGFTAETTLEGIAMRADFFILKKGQIGTFIMVIYKITSTPPITIQEIADILDERLTSLAE